MMNSIKKYQWVGMVVIGFIAVALGACSKSDDYKKYLEGGEITYTGKIDSVTVYSGHERVYVTGLFKADPKIEKLIVYWGNRADSVTVPIERTPGIDTLQLYIPIEEGVHNFEFVTVDGEGNRSLSVFRTGTSYGNRYISGLINRPYNLADYFAGDLAATIGWGGIDLTSGATFTEVEFTNTEGKRIIQLDSIHVSESILKDYMPGSSLRYRTVFLPDTISVDTFYSSYVSDIVPNLAYLRNISFPFQRAAYDGNRWGTPAGWTVNDAARNIGNGAYGGYELRGVGGALSLEGGWGLPGVINGKIYQTTNLQPGTYRITISAIERGAAGSVHFAVAEGKALPNEADLDGNTLVYTALPDNNARTVEFTLSKAAEITVGFIGNMPDSGSYFKVIGDIVFEVL